MTARRAVILPVILLLIGLLALTMAGFVFFVRAGTQGILATAEGEQAWLAADSGREQVVAILREHPHDARVWYDNAALFRHQLVWGQGFDRQSDPVRQAGNMRTSAFDKTVSAAPAWRFSIVAENLDGLKDTLRYGLTPESGKLDLNTASEAQLTQLMTPLLGELGIDNPQDLINALLDWRDDDDDVRPNSGENEYYNQRTPPYNCKNGAFDTVEELLLVRGFTPAVLWGEDVNRNGILDANENDAEASFPLYDNSDSVLNRGVAPFLTVYAREVDTALDNKPRINLNSDAAVIQAQVAALAAEAEDAESLAAGESPAPQLSQASLAFILQLKSSNFDFAQLGSPANLYVSADAFGDDGRESGAGGEEEGQEAETIPQELAGSPITLEEVPILMDRYSVRPADQANQPIAGLININTAPARVLTLIPGMTAEAAQSLVEQRRQLDSQTLRTPAWPLTTGAMSPALFRRCAPYMTTKAYQYHVEALGYSDTSKMVRRFEWLIEMIGPLAQVKYFRELTGLGSAWLIDDERVIVQQP